MVGVLEILKEAAGINRIPEIQITHPDPENRIEKIRKAIKKRGENSEIDIALSYKSYHKAGFSFLSLHIIFRHHE